MLDIASMDFGESSAGLILDDRIRETLEAGLMELGRGMVVVVMREGPVHEWPVAYVTATEDGFEILDEYDPSREMVLCFVDLSLEQATLHRIDLPWRVGNETLH